MRRAFMLGLLGLGAGLLPGMGSAQSSSAIESWQKTITQTQPAQTGCFQAAYPSTQWQPVFCAQAQQAPVLPWRPPAWSDSPQTMLSSPIGNYGYSASAVGAPIWAAEGSFLNVTGVTSIVDSVYGQNVYSLQINTEYFNIPGSSSLCGNSQGCTGWVQFVYQNYVWLNWGYLSMWYWVRGANSCQATWSASGGGWCYSYYGVNVPLQPVSSFNNQINLSGKTVNGVDTAALTIGGQAYSAATSSRIRELSQLWQQAQFNAFGLGNYASVSFTNGALLTINTKIDNGTTNVPNCSVAVGTGESNRLYHNSPCCRYAGGKPSIAFIEGTDDNANKFTCADLGNHTIMPVVTPAGGGTIAPATALQVPSRAVSTFTVTPKSPYKIGSVTGCAGSLTGNVFTTAPATGNCTVTATFTSSGPYTITASVNGTGGGAISPSGSLSVAAGSTRAFTLTPSTNYQVASVGGTCGGTLSGNTFTTRAITANCTVVASFTYSPNNYIITASVGAGGTISPSGYLTVRSGTTQAFTVTPSVGYYIASISGCGGAAFTGNSTHTTARNYATGSITGACTVYASFGRISTYTVTGYAYSGGAISPPSAQVRSGMTQTFTVTPNAGYYIASISGCGGATFTGNSTNTTARNYATGSITGACTVYASFNQVPTYTITAHSSSGGTIGPQLAQMRLGTTQPFMVTPSAGYYIASVSGCGGVTFTGDNTITTARSYTSGPITGNCTVYASFGQVTAYTAMGYAYSGGAISPLATQVRPGATQTFTITPSAGYYISSINGCGGTTFTGNKTNTTARNYATGPVTSACIVAAAFGRI
jgi:hypothetical protein